MTTVECLLGDGGLHKHCLKLLQDFVKIAAALSDKTKYFLSLSFIKFNLK